MSSLFWKIFWLMFFAVIQNAATAIGGVHLSEILADPARDWNNDGTISSRGDEWLEIYNSGPGAQDLAEFYVRDALGVDPQMQLKGILGPGEVALFFGTDAEDWQSANGFSLTGLSLNNAGDQLELWHGWPASQNATLMDIHIYPNHVGADDRSVARIFPTDQWVLFDGHNPYRGSLEPMGTDCLPSPGVFNECENLVSRTDSTWGDVKSQYR